MGDRVIQTMSILRQCQRLLPLHSGHLQNQATAETVWVHRSVIPELLIPLASVVIEELLAP